jgi:hypothetical protein
MPVQYSQTSSYYSTPINNNYLSVWVNRPIPKESDDLSFTINSTYDLRPDLLAYDLYGDPQLWWVFAQRNPNTLTDPLGSFRQGVTIYLPKLPTLKSVLGF